MNKLAHVLEAAGPNMAVTFTEPIGLDTMWKIAAIADVAELRADKFPSQEPDYLAAQSRKLTNVALPVLLTIRSASEKGGWADSEEDRLGLYTTLLPEVDGVDIELEAPILPDVIEAAHGAGKIVIASSHNFKVTPLLTTFEAQWNRAQEAGADYAKFAANTETFEDYKRLAEFTLRHKGSGIITVGMDRSPTTDEEETIYRWGRRSRISLPWLGSRLTYASTGQEAVAPGQMSYLETYERLRRRYPAYTLLSKD